MKKIILKIIFFFLILLLLLIGLSCIFHPKNNTAEAGMEINGATQILGEKENTIDIIVLGNSEAFTSIIPMKLWEDKRLYMSYLWLSWTSITRYYEGSL